MVSEAIVKKSLACRLPSRIAAQIARSTHDREVRLEPFIKECRAIEASIEEQEYYDWKSGLSINLCNLQGNIEPLGVKRTRHDNRTTIKPNPTCDRCGKSGHSRDDCYVLRIKMKCLHCQKIGHSRAVCHARAQGVMLNIEPERQLEEQQLEEQLKEIQQRLTQIKKKQNFQTNISQPSTEVEAKRARLQEIEAGEGQAGMDTPAQEYNLEELKIETNTREIRMTINGRSIISRCDSEADTAVSGKRFLQNALNMDLNQLLYATDATIRVADKRPLTILGCIDVQAQIGQQC